MIRAINNLSGIYHAPKVLNLDENLGILLVVLDDVFEEIGELEKKMCSIKRAYGLVKRKAFCVSQNAFLRGRVDLGWNLDCQ